MNNEILEGQDDLLFSFSDFDLTKPTLSSHLKVLTDTGLLLRDKRGREVYFTINTSVAEDLLTELAGVFFGESAEELTEEFEGSGS